MSAEPPPRHSIQRLLGDLDELRKWMLENGAEYARVGDLELRLDLNWQLLAKNHDPEGRQSMAPEVDAAPDSEDPYDDPIWKKMGIDMPKLTGKQPGDSP